MYAVIAPSGAVCVSLRESGCIGFLRKTTLCAIGVSGTTFRRILSGCSRRPKSFGTRPHNLCFDSGRLLQRQRLGLIVGLARYLLHVNMSAECAARRQWVAPIVSQSAAAATQSAAGRIDSKRKRCTVLSERLSETTRL